MHLTLRLSTWTGMLLLAAAPVAGAESPLAGTQPPLPDPVAPAVLGRPLDQIRPARPLPRLREKPVAATKARPKQVAAGNKATPARRPQAAAARVAPQAPVARVVPQAPVARVAPQTSVARSAPQAPSRQMARKGSDPQVAARTQVVGAGRATLVASRPLAPGAYFSSEDQALVRRYYASSPPPREGAKWKAGEPMPARAALTGVPDDLRAALPLLPPGHQYVQLDGEVVLVAVQSRTVVDGVSRGVR